VAGAVEWRNGLGQSQWQPILNNGKRMYVTSLGGIVWEVGLLSEAHKPALLDEKSGAVAIAQEWENHLLHVFHEVM